MKIKITILILVILYGCKTNTDNSENICETLSIMYKKDQKYRGLEFVQDPIFSILDSLKEAKGIDKMEYAKWPKDAQLKFGKMAREIADKSKYTSKREIDSMMLLQEKIDAKNTVELIQIVKDYGFPNLEKLQCKVYSAPFLIFGHSPKAYWKEIKMLIEDEYKKGNISDGDYDYILWHISGREGDPIKNSSEDIIIQG